MTRTIDILSATHMNAISENVVAPDAMAAIWMASRRLGFPACAFTYTSNIDGPR